MIANNQRENKEMTYQISDIEKMLQEITQGELGLDALGYIRGENGESILDRTENAPFVEAAPSIVRQLLRDLKEMKDRFENEEKANMKLGQKLVNDYASAPRLIDWINNPKRKPAITEFTEGCERQVAYAIERLLEAQRIIGEGTK